MIIFNLWAIPVGLLVALVCTGLFKLSPDLLGGAHENLTIACVTVLVGGLGELFGLKARLFFLPLWLIGAGVGAYQAWSLFGGVGLAIGLVAVVALLVAFVATIAWSTRNDVEEIPQRLAEARAAFAKGDLDEAREALASAWVTPLFSKLTAEHAQKLLPVVAMVEAERERLGVDPLWTATLARTRHLLQLAGTQGPYGFFSDEQMVINAMEPWLRDPEKRPSDELVQELTKGAVAEARPAGQ